MTMRSATESPPIFSYSWSSETNADDCYDFSSFRQCINDIPEDIFTSTPQRVSSDDDTTLQNTTSSEKSGATISKPSFMIPDPGIAINRHSFNLPDLPVSFSSVQGRPFNYYHSIRVPHKTTTFSSSTRRFELSPFAPSFHSQQSSLRFPSPQPKASVTSQSQHGSPSSLQESSQGQSSLSLVPPVASSQSHSSCTPQLCKQTHINTTTMPSVSSQVEASLSTPTQLSTSVANSTRPRPPSFFSKALAESLLKQLPVSLSQLSLSQPIVSQPTLSQPSLSQPAVSQPSLSQPSLAKPSISQPSLSQPTISQPSISQPSLSQPSLTKPSFIKPPLTEPSLAKPPLTEPPLVEPSFSKPSLAKPSLFQPPLSYATAVKQSSIPHTTLTQSSLSTSSLYSSTLYSPSLLQSSVMQRSVEKPAFTPRSLTIKSVTQPQPSFPEQSLTNSLSKLSLTNKSEPPNLVSKPSMTQTSLSHPSVSQTTFSQSYLMQKSLTESLSQLSLTNTSITQTSLLESSSTQPSVTTTRVSQPSVTYPPCLMQLSVTPPWTSFTPQSLHPWVNTFQPVSHQIQPNSQPFQSNIQPFQIHPHMYPRLQRSYPHLPYVQRSNISVPFYYPYFNPMIYSPLPLPTPYVGIPYLPSSTTSATKQTVKEEIETAHHDEVASHPVECKVEAYIPCPPYYFDTDSMRYILSMYGDVYKDNFYRPPDDINGGNYTFTINLHTGKELPEVITYNGTTMTVKQVISHNITSCRTQLCRFCDGDGHSTKGCPQKTKLDRMLKKEFKRAQINKDIINTHFYLPTSSTDSSTVVIKSPTPSL